MMTGLLRNPIRFLQTLVSVALLATAVVSARAEPVPVVATFSVLGDMVKQIGGDRVAVTTLVGPDGDSHVYQPSPSDARAVAEARLVVVNGLGFEGWMERLLETADFDGVLVTTTDGIDPLQSGESNDHHADPHTDSHEDGGEEHHQDGDTNDKAHEEDEQHYDDEASGHEQAEHREHGEHHADHGHDHGAYDPHAWHDPASAEIYARNVARGLSAVDAVNEVHYHERLTNYLEKIATLDAEISASIAQLPANRRTVVTSHDALQYFGRAYGLTFLAPQGMSTDSEASAEDVAHLIRQIREQGITAVFVENLGDPRLIKRIADETDAAIGGTLYTDALSPADGPAPTYLDMLRTNAAVLHEALKN